MLIRKTEKNQVVIPKALFKRAGLDDRRLPWFDIEYREGGFFLKPMRATAVRADEELFQLLDKFQQRSKALGLTEADVAKEVKAYRKEQKSSRKAA